MATVQSTSTNQRRIPFLPRFQGLMQTLKEWGIGNESVRVLRGVDQDAPHLDALAEGLVISAKEGGKSLGNETDGGGERTPAAATTVPVVSRLPGTEKEISSTSEPVERGRVPVFRQGTPVPAVVSRPADDALNSDLARVVGFTSLGPDGKVTRDRIVRFCLDEPMASQRMANGIAERWLKGGITDAVIVGFGSAAGDLSCRVGQAIENLRTPPGAPMTPVFRLLMSEAEGTFQFPCEDADVLLRGKRVFVVTPVITQSSWEDINSQITFLEERGLNTNVMGIGCIILYGEVPRDMKDGFRVVQLLSQTGLRS